MKRFGQLLTVALFASALWTSSANAAADWYKVQVSFAGMASPTLLTLRLTDTGGAFTLKDFKNTSDIKKEMLASALTAFALESNVWVFTDTDPGTGGPTPEIIFFYITKE